MHEKKTYLVDDRYFLTVFRIGSGFGLDLDLFRSVDPYPAPDSESVSGSRRAKMTHKSRKKLRNFIFEVLDVLCLEPKASFVIWSSFMEV